MNSAASNDSGDPATASPTADPATASHTPSHAGPTASGAPNPGEPAAASRAPNPADHTSGGSEDEDFARRVADRLAELPTVQAVALGGSRAQGDHRADSDWDFAVYYRGAFDPQHLRDIGWPGEVSEIGGWGGGVFNGGAWLEVDGRPVDVHYRDLDDVEHQLAEVREGRFTWQPLMFHLAGIPSYLVCAELAVNRVLHGSLPRPEYPPALRESAPQVWWGQAEAELTYARNTHARHGRSIQTAGAIARSACQTAHAILAARGEWITNEKQLLTRAGLRDLDDTVAAMTADDLVQTVDRVKARLEQALTDARNANP